MTNVSKLGGLVLVDKPAGMTSHSVVGVVRRYFGTKKVGHAGTLDPMATGLLVVGVERGTKFLAHLVAETKTYEATIRLGVETSTEDADGEVIRTADASGVTDEDIAREVSALTGDIMQRPSSVSAIKINGKRAHQLVREGETVEIPPRPVTIHSFDILERDGDSLRVRVHCSSGTYIRALARDLGHALGVGAHLTALRRLTVGPFTIAEATPLAQLEDAPELSLSLDEALQACYPPLAVTEEEAQALSEGKWLAPRGLKGTHAAVAPDGRSIALIKEQGKRLATVFVARPSTL